MVYNLHGRLLSPQESVIHEEAKALMKHLRLSFGRRYVKITFAGHMLTLDTRWQHERSYLNYIKRSKINGPLGMDVWVFSHFVNPGHTVLDAGANIGFTALLAKKAGATEIYCFEPDPRLTQRLKTHCQGNKIVIYPKALGEKPGSLQLCLSSQHNQGSTLSDKMVNKFPSVFQGSEFIQVDVETIDGIFGTKHFDFFKIDVEGAEIATLKGASSILKSSPPNNIYIEMFDEFFDEAHEFLKEYYDFAYRIVCDRSGSCRLFPFDIDTSQMKSEGFYVTPPSYIYSKSEQEELTKCWTRPALR
jgi:FkbM family methyltransferase